MVNVNEMTLLPFSRGDWLAYNGCESIDPSIGYAPTGHAVVLDGAAVLVDLDGQMWFGEFSDRLAARATALAIVGGADINCRLARIE
jgi:hypothetical protein